MGLGGFLIVYLLSTPKINQKDPINKINEGDWLHFRKALTLFDSFKKNGDEREIKQAKEEVTLALTLNSKNRNAFALLKRLDREDSPEIVQDIQSTLEVLKKRPDYSSAWLRLAILYDEIGDMEKAKDAREHLKVLAPDLNN